MANILAFTGARIFDSQRWLDGSALLVQAGIVLAIVPERLVPSEAVRLVLVGGTIVPGFVDLQVNGGGGELFNNNPTLDAIQTICSAHARYGTTALLPTLITDTVDNQKAAIAAGVSAAAAFTPGFLGLHLEGPHLAATRKGTHERSLIRAMDTEDLGRLISARQYLPNLLVTVAAETVGPEQIAALVRQGVIVSVGHSDAGYAMACDAFAAGATQVTHLFNAMSQLQNREPGVVGAALETPGVYAGIIADGIHVHPATLRVALRSKRGQGHLFLVTDAMSQTGTELATFELNGRTVYRAKGALRLGDGTLSGADLNMIDAVQFMSDSVGVSWEEALRMASLYPARALGVDDHHGHLLEGALANFVHLAANRKILSTWVKGEQVF